jgi:hypothetical protein
MRLVRSYLTFGSVRRCCARRRQRTEDWFRLLIGWLFGAFTS